MLVQQLHQIGKDRKPPSQIGQRGIGGVAGIAVLLAPRLAGLVILGNRIARGFQLGPVGRLPLFRKGGMIKAGGKEGSDLGHGHVIAQPNRAGEGAKHRIWPASCFFDEAGVQLITLDRADVPAPTQKGGETHVQPVFRRL